MHEEVHELDTVDSVVDTNERQLASRFRDAGEIDTQLPAGTMFTFGCLEEESPLGVPQEGSARGDIPVVFVENATEGTGTDGLHLVEDRPDVWIEKQTERSPKATLLIERSRNGEQAVRQNASALPERLRHSQTQESGSAFFVLCRCTF